MTRHLRRRTAQGLLALLAGLWLLAAAAPCVMAAPHCPHGMSGDCPSMEHAGQSAAGDCDALTAVDCQSADQEQLAATTPVMDFSVVPVRLHGLPAVAVLRTPHTPDRYATVILSPPLNLQHAVLLI